MLEFFHRFIKKKDSHGTPEKIRERKIIVGNDHFSIDIHFLKEQKKQPHLKIQLMDFLMNQPRENVMYLTLSYSNEETIERFVDSLFSKNQKILLLLRQKERIIGFLVLGFDPSKDWYEVGAIIDKDFTQRGIMTTFFREFLLNGKFDGLKGVMNYKPLYFAYSHENKGMVKLLDRLIQDCSFLGVRLVNINQINDLPPSVCEYVLYY